jgi:hypothetical protein
MELRRRQQQGEHSGSMANDAKFASWAAEGKWVNPG